MVASSHPGRTRLRIAGLAALCALAAPGIYLSRGVAAQEVPRRPRPATGPLVGDQPADGEKGCRHGGREWREAVPVRAAVGGMETCEQQAGAERRREPSGDHDHPSQLRRPELVVADDRRGDLESEERDGGSEPPAAARRMAPGASPPATITA